MKIKTKYQIGEQLIMEGNSVYPNGIPVEVQEVIVLVKRPYTRISYNLIVTEGSLRNCHFNRVEKKLIRKHILFNYKETK